MTSITLTLTQFCISMPLSSWLTMTLEESNQSPLRVPRSELWALSYSDSTSPTYRHGTEWDYHGPYHVKRLADFATNSQDCPKIVHSRWPVALLNGIVFLCYALPRRCSKRSKPHEDLWLPSTHLRLRGAVRAPMSPRALSRLRHRPSFDYSPSHGWGTKVYLDYRDLFELGTSFRSSILSALNDPDSWGPICLSLLPLRSDTFHEQVLCKDPEERLGDLSVSAGICSLACLVMVIRSNPGTLNSSGPIEGQGKGERAVRFSFEVKYSHNLESHWKN